MSVDKPEFNGDASVLVDLELLRPLAAFPFASRPISDHLHSLGYGWYLLVGSRGPFDDGLPPETVRACMVLWASDIAGALLATSCGDNVAQGRVESPNPLPSVEKLVAAPGWTYSELIKAGRGKVAEGAVYDGANGLFRFKELRFPTVTVYFRSRRRKNSELPFAIDVVGRVWWATEPE